MRKLFWLSAFCMWPAVALAAEYSSTYTKFDPAKCREVEKGDDSIFAGTKVCEGYQGIDILYAEIDEQTYVGFGKKGKDNCAFHKTFVPSSTALVPIEWRLRDGQPIAAIERWNVGDEMDLQAKSWLVVTALKDGEACHVHYVAGSYPDASAQARRAADDLAEDFNCENDVPTVDSKVGPPPIEMLACKDLRSE